MCFESPVDCKKDFELCLGTCSGDETSTLSFDFATMIGRGELSPDVLGEDGFAAAAANCTLKTETIFVPLFDGGQSFAQFVTRLRIRSGMTAIDPSWCENNPLSCGGIQKALERSPGLRFSNGRFHHAYSLLSPSPPPPPTPPPRTLFYGPDPPSPPPPPISPPPFFDNAEDCIPLPTAEFFGVPTERVTENSDPVRERALCVFLKAVKEQTMPADRCFSEMASPKPPPPPPAGGLESAQNIVNEFENERINGDFGVKDPAGLDEESHLAAEIQESLAETRALIASFGETSPVLRSILLRSAEQMESSILAARDAAAAAAASATETTSATSGINYGRRLMSRQFEFATKLTDVLVDHEIQKDKYSDGIPGITRLDCEALCTAVTEQNASRTCRAMVFKRQYPFSRTDRSGRCYLLKSSGSCFGRDFGAQLLTRQIESENVCEEIAPGLHDTACVSLPASRDDLRVLSHKDATDMAAVTPENAPTSAGRLPLPMTVLEAMSLVAFARQYGIYSFWLRSPDSDGEVVVPIITAGGTNLVYHATETRCILVSSATSTAYSAMYASLHPCGAHLSDGLVAVAVSTGPPPPPGAASNALRHFPPPPPSSKAIAMSIWKRANIVPETRVICSGAAGEGKVHRDICEKVLEDWGPFRFIVGVGTISPLCSPLCFHSCEGDHIGADDIDSFNNCKLDECAQTSCRDFLDRECPLAIATQIRDTFRDYCTIAPPSPPALNLPPPPPLPPYSPSPMPPPPFVNVVERTRDGEIASDPDCGMIHYDECLEIVRQYGVKNGFLPNLRITTSTCTGVETDTDCFVGCSYGTRNGGVYRILLDGDDSIAAKYTHKRCAMSEHPICACTPDSVAPPPGIFAPPPPAAFSLDWEHANIPTEARDTSKGTVSAMLKRITNGRTMDLSLRSGPMHAIECPGDDDGRHKCALTCAGIHLNRLRAFSITGENLFDPPNPPPPPLSPSPSSPPFMTANNATFSGCTDSCIVPETELLCRDGGQGSFLPALCAFGTKCSKCGVRTDLIGTGDNAVQLRSVTQLVDGDNSCPYAFDGLCQDGRPSSPTQRTEFIFIDPQTSTHLCPYLTDAADCGPGTISSLDGTSFTNLPQPPLPRPPPPPPPLPPSPAPPFVSCRTDCEDDEIWVAPTDPNEPDLRFCSDGGLNSLAIGVDPQTFGPIFKCDIGTQCKATTTGSSSDPTAQTNLHLCEFRLPTPVLCLDSCLASSITGGVKWVGSSRNGVCEDGGSADSVTYSGTFATELEENGKRYVTIAGCGYGKNHHTIMR